jgi:TRAP-type C4-dicarboxylate transport system substrate-binding protein
MIRLIPYLIATALLLIPALAAAGPITLKLAFFSSDRTHLYRSGVAPFVDAVNKAGRGRVHIDVYLSRTLGGDTTKESQLLLGGSADIAYIIQSYEQTTFPGATVIELPGLYRNGHEATLVFKRLVDAGMMPGFDPFHVIGVFASEPESIHSRLPISSLAALKGQRIRTNNDVETAILDKLGAKPVFVPLYETANAIMSGKIDGAMAPPVPMMEFGIGRVSPNHYFLGTASVPQSLLMSKARFDSLPADVQEIIRKYSGDWFTEQYNQINDTATAAIMTQIKNDSRRKAVFPSPADMKTADAVFKSVVADYIAKSPRHAALVKAAEGIVATIRPGN